jgi:hypothetical protein
VRFLRASLTQGISSAALTVLGTVLGLVVSFRTSSAYDRWALYYVEAAVYISLKPCITGIGKVTIPLHTHILVR